MNGMNLMIKYSKININNNKNNIYMLFHNQF